jgi:lysine-specific demethylase 8
MTTSADFTPLDSSTDALPGRVGGDRPLVLRGAASGWPAVQRWTFDHLARLDPRRPVRLVSGNRERGATRFVEGTLGEYLTTLDSPPAGEPPRYLKEFDLLTAFPHLRAELRTRELFPPRTIRSSSVWIGPATARTGLHHDLLDNVAVQVIGTKRFYLAPPGSVERHQALAPKYDSWARLARVTAAEVADLQAGVDDPQSRPLVVDLSPGDALYVPRRWWHEVENLTPSLLLSGFFGHPLAVLPAWLRVTARDGLHRLGLVGRSGCTCHPAGQDGQRSPSPEPGSRTSMLPVRGGGQDGVDRRFLDAVTVVGEHDVDVPGGQVGDVHLDEGALPQIVLGGAAGRESEGQAGPGEVDDQIGG